MYDVAIVGAGAAGLTAAMVLGRQRRQVLLLDHGTPRNAPAAEMHMYLTRDGADPALVRELGRTELAVYDSVEVRDVEVLEISGALDDFSLTLAGGDLTRARRVLLTTGLRDHLPDIPGLWDRFGRTVVHCPFCHGWESRDSPLAVLGGTDVGVLQALYVADRFSSDVVLLTNGPFTAPPPLQAEAAARGIVVEEQPIARIEGEHDVQVVLTDGRVLERAYLFAFPGTTAQSDLGTALGATVLPDGCLAVDAAGRTDVPGVSAAGDAAHSPDLPGPASSVIASAGAGASTAMWLEQDLFRSSLPFPLPG